MHVLEQTFKICLMHRKGFLFACMPYKLSVRPKPLKGLANLRSLTRGQIKKKDRVDFASGITQFVYGFFIIFNYWCFTNAVAMDGLKLKVNILTKNYKFS